ncbi:hypothetical protein RJ640_019945 [Escallonia rubra]|uniref:RING-type E3 ubiquitin transferase n=1 Tax=Escallonia rubra TaxID=112253 RepID=A0AA88U004_9ASTE|nr:hypothetical protein RJ640_019945 [Escallonia rubra]
MDDDTTTAGVVRDNDPSRSYAVSGKIMLFSVFVLLVACIIITCFHMYSRRYHVRRARNLRHPQNRLRRTHHFSFSSDADAATSAAQKGLDPSVLESIPTILYASAADESPLECAVCLSEFEEKEWCRLLPRCNHCFHLNCIDMWFHSHSNCPLCRSPVQPPQVPGQSTEKPLHTIITVAQPASSEPQLSSGGILLKRDEHQISGSSSTPSPV